MPKKIQKEEMMKANRSSMLTAEDDNEDNSVDKTCANKGRIEAHKKEKKRPRKRKNKDLNAEHMSVEEIEK